MALIFKILDASLWQIAYAKSVFDGAGIDLKDGYIHFSTRDQLRETARLHFSAQENLMLFAIDETTVAQKIRWEPSRGGKLFPHVYGTIALGDIIWAKPLPWNGTEHVFPSEIGL